MAELNRWANLMPSYSWMDRADIEASAKVARDAGSRVNDLRRADNMTPKKDARATFTSTHRRHVERRAIVAALSQWRVMTPEQLETVTGLRVCGTKKADLRAVFDAGLIFEGRPSQATTKDRLWPSEDVLYRTGDIDPRKPRSLAQWMSASELEAMLGSWPHRKANTGAERHDILTNTFLLDLAAFGMSRLVWSEGASKVHLPAGLHSPRNTTWFADGGFHLDGGPMVFVEMTCSNGQSSRAKVEHWNRFLRSPEGAHCAVLFINGGSTQRSRHNEVAALLRDRIGYAAQYGAGDRMGYVSWRDLYSPEGECIMDPYSFDVQMPMKSGERGQEWVTVDWFNSDTWNWAHLHGNVATDAHYATLDIPEFAIVPSQRE